jgi:hypothetical protein
VVCERQQLNHDECVKKLEARKRLERVEQANEGLGSVSALHFVYMLHCKLPNPWMLQCLLSAQSLIQIWFEQLLD